MYLRDITFVTDVSIPTIKTIKLVFKLTGISATVSFLKTFGYLYDDFEINKKGTSAKKVTMRTRTRMSKKSVSRYEQILTTQVERLHAISHFIQHKTFSALNYAQDFGNRMK